MASSERSLSELLQAAQHMTNKADGGGVKPSAAFSVPSVSQTPKTPAAAGGVDLPKVDRSLAQLVQVT